MTHQDRLRVYDEPLPVGNEIIHWYTVDDQNDFERWSLYAWKGLLVARSSDYRYHVFNDFNELLPKLSSERCILDHPGEIPTHVRTLVDVFKYAPRKADSLPTDLREQLVGALVAKELS